MNEFSQHYNEEQFAELNNSNFEKEGEYIIQQKPKYKYEIRIVHQNPNNKSIKKPKTPDKIISSSNFSILSDKKRNKNNINSKRQRYKYNKLAVTPDRNSYIKFFPKKISKKNGINKSHKFIGNYYCIYDNCDYENNNSNNCICQREFNKIISKYNQNGNNGNYTNRVCRCGYIFRNGNKNDENNNVYKRKNFYFGNRQNKEKYYNYFLQSQNNNINTEQSKILKLNNYNNNNLYKGKSFSYKRRKKVKKYKNKKLKLPRNNTEDKIVYDNISNYSFISIDDRKQKHEHKKNKKKLHRNNTEDNLMYNNASNYSFISIDDTKQKNKNKNNKYKNISYISPIKKDNNFNNVSTYRLQKNNPNNNSNYNNNNLSNIMLSPRSNSKINNNNIIINKSSETKQNIKIIPLGQKINPLIIKKVVQKPKIVKIINKDGSTTDVIKQNSIITSIESKAIMNNNKENIVQENVTNVYTTLTKNLEDISNSDNNIYNDIDKNDINYNDKNDINYSFNDKNEINYINKEKENNSVLIRRDFKNKNENDCKLEEINNPNINLGKNYSFNNVINEYQNNNTNNNFNNMELNDNSTIQKISDYSSVGNSLNFIENKIISKKEQINYIKYLYYNDLNKLNNYYQILNDEEKKNILNSFNNGNKENQKIYTYLKNISKNKKNNDDEEIAIIVDNNSIEDNDRINNKEEINDSK